MPSPGRSTRQAFAFRLEQRRTSAAFFYLLPRRTRSGKSLRRSRFPVEICPTSGWAHASCGSGPCSLTWMERRSGSRSLRERPNASSTILSACLIPGSRSRATSDSSRWRHTKARVRGERWVPPSSGGNQAFRRHPIAKMPWLGLVMCCSHAGLRAPCRGAQPLH